MDDMQRMMIMQQMQAQGQQQGQQPQGGRMPAPNMQQSPQFQGMGLDTGKRSPIEEGSMMALNSTKRSLQMNESENQRALGRALLTMLGSIDNNPAHGTGFSGNLSAIASGISPALLEYDNERNRIEGVNYGLLKAKKEEEALARKEDREMKKMHHEMDIANKKLKIDQGYLGIKSKEKEDERKEMELLSKPGGEVPLGSLSTSGWNYAQKYLDSNSKELEGAKNSINSIDEASEILERNPGITKHWGTILSASQQDDPGYLKQKLLRLVNEKDLKDAQLLSKNLSNLYTSGAGGFSPRAMNKYWEKEMKKGVATPDLLASTSLHLFKDARKNAVDIYKNRYDVHDAFHNRGSFKRAKPSSLDYDPEETTKYEKIKSNEMAKKLQELEQLEQMMQTAPD